MDYENCRHLTVVGLHDTGPWILIVHVMEYIHTQNGSRFMLSPKELGVATLAAVQGSGYRHTSWGRLVGLVVKTSAWRVEDLGFKSRLCWIFSGLSHTSNLKTGTPVATLPGAWGIGSVLGLVGQVSVHCDCVRWKVMSETSECGSTYNCLINTAILLNNVSHLKRFLCCVL